MKGIRALSASVGAVALALTLMVFVVCPVPPGQATSMSVAPVLGERFMQVVAHPDDDLLFMSPDLYGAVMAGRPSVTVYLTAGEGTAGLDDQHDPVAYAREREEGLHAAYAYLAGVRNLWSSSWLNAGSMRVRVDALADRPGIRLVFAGLPDGGDPRADGGRDALIRVWSDGACVRPFTQSYPAPSGQPVAAAWRFGPRRPFSDRPGPPFPSGRPCVNRAGLTGMLHVLLMRFRANVLRTLDPHPPRARLGDHPDHVASARLATEAAAGLPVTVVAYRGYPMTVWSPNVAARMRDLKREIFRIYRDHDYRIRYGWHYRAWLERMYRIPHP